MKLTALEIKQQQFEKSLRGYDTTEVNAFLSQVASEWEHMSGRIRELETRVEKMQDKLERYERVEDALHETLQTAKNSAEEKLSSAKNEARIIVEKAELEADSILEDARQQRRDIRQSISQLIDKRNEMVSTLRAFLDQSGEYLNQFKEDNQSLFTLPEQETSPKKKKKNTTPEKASGDMEPDDSSTDLHDSDEIDDILNDID